MLVTTDNCKRYSEVSPQREACNSLLAGAFIRCTRKIFGGDIPGSASDELTVNSLVVHLMALHNNKDCHAKHPQCWNALTYSTEVESVKSNVSSSLSFGEQRFSVGGPASEKVMLDVGL